MSLGLSSAPPSKPVRATTSKLLSAACPPIQSPNWRYDSTATKRWDSRFKSEDIREQAMKGDNRSHSLSNLLKQFRTYLQVLTTLGAHSFLSPFIPLNKYFQVWLSLVLGTYLAHRKNLLPSFLFLSGHTCRNLITQQMVLYFCAA